MLDLEAFLRHHRHGLDVHVRRRQREALLRDRGRGRNAAAQDFAPDILIGRHRFDRGVVLVGAHEVGALGAGGAQHGVEIVEDARGLLLALGEARMRQALRDHVGRDAVDEVLRHQAGREHPAAGLHALREPDLAGAELDRQQRLHGTRYARLVHEILSSGCPNMRFGRTRTKAISVAFDAEQSRARRAILPPRAWQSHTESRATELRGSPDVLRAACRIYAPSPTRTRACLRAGTSRVGQVG